MKLSSISTAISALAHTKAVRGADSADTQIFSGLLLQQGQARERDMATIPSTAAANTAAKEALLGTGAHSDAYEENSAVTQAGRDESLTPEGTLALLAAGATLPLVTLAKGMAVDEPEIDTSKVRGRGLATDDSETIIQIRTGTDPHSPLVPKEALLGTGAHSDAYEENSAVTQAGRDESLTPEGTLALLAAGATLPLITLAKGMAVDEPEMDTSKVRGRGLATDDSETIVQIRTGTDPHSPLVPKEALLGTGAHSETLNHTRDSAPKSHQTIQAVVDSRSINTQGIHPVQPDRPQQFALQQTPTATASGMGAITAAANQFMDLSDPQDSSAIPAGASVFAGTSIQGQSTSPVMPAVSTPLSNPAWATDFSRQFIALTQGNLAQPHTAELRLDPPELGPIRITLHISDSVAQATFVSPHAVVRQAIEGALPQLQQQLAQAGLSLGQTNVSDQQQPSQQDSSQGAGNTSLSLLGSHTGTQDSAPSPVPSQRRAPHSPDALVDTFA